MIINYKAKSRFASSLCNRRNILIYTLILNPAPDYTLKLGKLNYDDINRAEGALVNSVGCGDSMVAGFLFGYLEKGDYEYALRLGVACGNATAYSEGLATKEKIQEALNQSFFRINVE